MKLTQRQLKNLVRKEFRKLMKESRSQNAVFDEINRMTSGGQWDVEEVAQHLAGEFGIDDLLEAEEEAEMMGNDMYYAIIEEAISFHSGDY